MLKFYTIANQTAGTVEALRVRAIEFARDLHILNVRRKRELATLSLKVRMRLIITEHKNLL